MLARHLLWTFQKTIMNWYMILCNFLKTGLWFWLVLFVSFEVFTCSGFGSAFPYESMWLCCCVSFTAQIRTVLFPPCYDKTWCWSIKSKEVVIDLSEIRSQTVIQMMRALKASALLLGSGNLISAGNSSYYISHQEGKIVVTLRKALFYLSVLVKASLDSAVLSERVVRVMFKSLLTTSLFFLFLYL